MPAGVLQAPAAPALLLAAAAARCAACPAARRRPVPPACTDILRPTNRPRPRPRQTTNQGMETPTRYVVWDATLSEGSYSSTFK